MKGRLMYWAGLNPHEVPVRDVIAFNESIEDIVEEHKDLIKAGVAEGVAKVLENIK